MFSMLYWKCLVIKVKRTPPPPGPEDVPPSMGPLLDHHPSGGGTDGDPSPPFACGGTEPPLDFFTTNAATLDRLCVCVLSCHAAHMEGFRKTAKLFIFKRATLIKTAAVSLTVRSFFHKRMFGQDRTPLLTSEPAVWGACHPRQLCSEICCWRMLAWRLCAPPFVFISVISFSSESFTVEYA